MPDLFSTRGVPSAYAHEDGAALYRSILYVEPNRTATRHDGQYYLLDRGASGVIIQQLHHTTQDGTFGCMAVGFRYMGPVIAMTGGSGQDVFRNNLAPGNATGLTLYGDFFGTASHETSTLGGRDRMFGAFSADRIYGQGGDDELGGAAGDDYLSGGSGNDRLFGGTGNDEMRGGSGNDVYYVDENVEIVRGSDGIERGFGDKALDAGGLDTVYTSVSLEIGYYTTRAYGEGEIVTGISSDVSFEGIETFVLTGSASDIVMSMSEAFGYAPLSNPVAVVGNDLSNSVQLTTQDNRVYGRGGHDVILASGTLHGEAGNDRIQSQGGTSNIYGGDGLDVLFGGGAADSRDRFHFNTTPDSGNNFDRIHNFSSVADALVFENAIFMKLGAPGFVNPGFVAFSNGPRDADDYLIYHQPSGTVFYDADANGAGAAVRVAIIENRAALTASDFIIV